MALETAAPLTPVAEDSLNVSSPSTRQTAEDLAAAANPSAQAAQDLAAVATVTRQSTDSLNTLSTVTAEAETNLSSLSAINVAVKSILGRTLNPIFEINAGQDLPVGVQYSRSTNNATYLEEYEGIHGNKKTILRRQRGGNVTNVSLQSEKLDASPWGVSNATVRSAKANHPLNANTFKLTDNDVDSTHIVTQTRTFTAGDHCLECDIKTDGLRYAMLVMFDGTTSHNAIFDLKNATVEQQSSGTFATGWARHIGNGWIRCSVHANVASGFGSIQIRGSQQTTSGYAGSFQSMFIARASLALEDYPVPHVETLDSSVTQFFERVPRIEKNGILLEGGNTNQILWSENFEDVTYGLVNVTRQRDQRLAPDGSLTADYFAPISDGLDSYLQTSISTTAGQQYCCSIYVKERGATQFTMYGLSSWTDTNRFVTFNLDTQEIISNSLEYAGIEDVGDGWLRCWFSQVADKTTVGTGSIHFARIEDSVALADRGVFIWGLQFEQNFLPSSYIRTKGVAESRGQDLMSAPFTPLLDYTIFVEADYPNNIASSNQRRAFDIRDDGGDSSIIVYNRGGNSNGFIARSRDVFTPSFPDFNLNESGLTKGVVVRDLGNFYFYSDGELIATQPFERPEDLDEINIGSGGGSFHLYGHIKRAWIIPLALTANEVKNL